MQVKRINRDSSWWIELGGVSFLLDPWLVGSEVDGFSWLNEQWHTTDPVDTSTLPPYRAVLVTQPYSDHCHEPTLQKLDLDKTSVIANAASSKRIRRSFPNLNVSLIPEFNQGVLEWEGLRICNFRSPRWIDPIYHALWIESDSESLFYVPHGFPLKGDALLFMQQRKVTLLLTTCMYFRIPEWLGGLVNPGPEAADMLVRQLNPKFIMNTHDERKRMKGLVQKTATILFPDFQQLSDRYPGRFLPTEDYAIRQL